MTSFDEIERQLSTIRDFVRWATSRFLETKLHFGHGIDSALSEAVYLVLHVLHLPPDFPIEYFDSALTTTEKKELYDFIELRVKQRLPAAYLTHEAWFANLPFYVDDRVLIPRSPLAEVIEERFEPWIDPERVNRILDIGTGSGCIAIACADQFPQAQVDAIDISQDALDVAKINVEKHYLQDQVMLIHSHLFQRLTDAQYDIIISNPPYVSTQEIQELPLEYQHEPELGLEAGEAGLDLVIPILEQAAQFLTAKGLLIVEVGNSKEALIERYPFIPFTWLEFERGGEGVFLLTKEQLVLSGIT